jgi:hypothetical protein
MSLFVLVAVVLLAGCNQERRVSGNLRVSMGYAADEEFEQPHPPAIFTLAEAAGKNWYFAHVENEICIPIDNIDSQTGKRRYYYHGGLRTPQQVKDYLIGYYETQGVSEEFDPGTITFRTPPDSDLGITLYDDEARCRAVMEKERP